MKTLHGNSLRILLIAITSTFAFIMPPQALADNARLIVSRAADFGTIIYLDLYIDGAQITTLGLNERYEAIVRPGEHVLTIGTTPSPYGRTRFTHQRVLMKPGQSYAFTAMWEGADRTILKPSDKVRRPLP